MAYNFLATETNFLPSVSSLLTQKSAFKEEGSIDLESITILENIPAIAWDYKLGNRSALEWILDQYKEKKPKDPTISQAV